MRMSKFFLDPPLEILVLSGNIEHCPGSICPNDKTRNIAEMSSLLRKRGIKIFHQNVRGLLPNINLVSVLLESFLVSMF